jgi:hypothetical protein
MVNIHPIGPNKLEHKISTYLQEFDSLSQSDPQFADDKLCYKEV